MAATLRSRKVVDDFNDSARQLNEFLGLGLKMPEHVPQQIRELVTEVAAVAPGAARRAMRRNTSATSA